MLKTSIGLLFHSNKLFILHVFCAWTWTLISFCIIFSCLLSLSNCMFSHVQFWKTEICEFFKNWQLNFSTHSFSSLMHVVFPNCIENHTSTLYKLSPCLHVQVSDAHILHYFCVSVNPITGIVIYSCKTNDVIWVVVTIGSGWLFHYFVAWSVNHH